MAAIDKMDEFYERFPRFVFLASCYRPEDLPKDVNQSLDVIVKFFYANEEFQMLCEKKIQEDQGWEREWVESQKRKLIQALMYG